MPDGTTPDAAMPDGGESEGLAPVIPLFGAAVAEPPAVTWNHTWAETPVPDGGGAGYEADAVVDAGEHKGIKREAAENHLRRKLRARSLSVREARVVLSAQELPGEEVDAIVGAFARNGYLDDRVLADQLVHTAADRRGQGRKAIALVLAKRGIPRDVVDQVISELPDDDAERALDFARSKARSMGSLDADTALRRLSGQLARRGYGGSTAFTAARAALDEVTRGRPSRVSFRES